MLIKKRDTIVAPATPSGHGGVAIVRVSGPEVKEIAKALLGRLPEPRKAGFFSFRDADEQTLDQGLAIFFPGPHSFTGEDILELQGHGSPVVVNLLVRRILGLGARLARPGEFSERAFLSGKMDLAQAEAVADLIHASTEQAARSALRSLQGEFSKRVSSLVETVIKLRVYLEAALDFAEEELDLLSDEGIQLLFSQIQKEIASIEEAAQQGSLLREGITLVIAGKPNVGKSTLLNLLSGKELAIVTDVPGTTRDILREHIQLDGLPLHLIDTAGLRDTLDPVEKEGIRRARNEIKQADLLLYMIDAQDTPPPDLDPQATLIVRNKIDLSGEAAAIEEKNKIKIISLSAKENRGLDLLKAAIKTQVGFAQQQEGSFSARQRHLAALEKARLSLNAAFHQLQTTRAGELIAEELRHAQMSLSEITGEFTNEDLLGKIFSSFCIGK